VRRYAFVVLGFKAFAAFPFEPLERRLVLRQVTLLPGLEELAGVVLLVLGDLAISRAVQIITGPAGRHRLQVCPAAAPVGQEQFYAAPANVRPRHSNHVVDADGEWNRFAAEHCGEVRSGSGAKLFSEVNFCGCFCRGCANTHLVILLLKPRFHGAFLFLGIVLRIAVMW